MGPFQTITLRPKWGQIRLAFLASSRMTAAATIGPAQAARPTSSTPAISEKPLHVLDARISVGLRLPPHLHGLFPSTGSLGQATSQPPSR